MSREIKFRAWNIKQKLMAKVSSLYSSMKIHVSYKKGKEKNGHFFGGNWVGADWNKEESIIMQFTGLKDKNGVDIYEGDVLEFPKSNTGVVKIETSGVCAVGFECFISNKMFHICKVIGNIHENKD